jgi:hypothetical protein
MGSSAIAYMLLNAPPAVLPLGKKETEEIRVGLH